MSFILRDVQIIRLATKIEFENYLKEIVNCYRIIFGGQDWKEWKICENGHKFSLIESEDKEACDFCQKPLRFYWPEEEVIKDMRHIFSLDDCCFVVALLDEKIIGFTFGYRMDERQAKKHFDNHLPYKLSRIIRSNSSCFWYQSDIGVDEKFRGKHLATKLFKKRMSEILEETDHNCFVVRSQPKAKTYHWYRQKIGYRMLSRYYRPDINEWRYLLYADRRLVHNYINK